MIEATARLESLCPSSQAVTVETHKRALEIAERYGYYIFRPLILAAALQSRYQAIFSEDLYDGQTMDGLTVRNPFSQA